jgi:hypothetical protein
MGRMWSVLFERELAKKATTLEDTNDTGCAVSGFVFGVPRRIAFTIRVHHRQGRRQ